MGNKLRDIFFPTEEKIEELLKMARDIREEEKNYYISIGFTKEEYEIISEIESYEQDGLRGWQSYYSRYSLLRDKIITIENVKEDIEKWLKS